MANEILPSSIGDLVAGEVLAAEYLYLLADRDNSVLGHPALLKASAPSGVSNIVRVPHIGLGGYNLLAARTPGSEVTNTALSDGGTDVTIAPYSKVYELDDLANFMLDGRVNASMFAMDAAISVGQTLISLIANIGDGFTADEGSGDLTWETLIAAKTALGVAAADGSAGLMALIHPYQWGDLERDSLSMGVTPAPLLAGSLNAGLGAYKGRYFGIDVYVSKAVPLDTGNYKGCLISKGAICWADTSYPTIVAPGANIMSIGNAIFEMERKGTFASTKLITHTQMGVAIGINSAGVTIVSAST